MKKTDAKMMILDKVNFKEKFKKNQKNWTHRMMIPRAGHMRKIMMLIALSTVWNASATSRKLRVSTNHVIPTALIAGEITA